MIHSTDIMLKKGGIINIGISTSAIAYHITQNNVPKISPDTSAIVYVTISGQKYQRETCRYVKEKDNTLEITINQAENKGYSPCLICKPENK